MPKYFKRIGTPGNYKYFYTKEQWDEWNKKTGEFEDTNEAKRSVSGKSAWNLIQKYSEMKPEEREDKIKKQIVIKKMMDFTDEVYNAYKNKKLTKQDIYKKMEDFAKKHNLTMDQVIAGTNKILELKYGIYS